MKSPDKFKHIYLYRNFVDMRKQAQGLAILIQEEIADSKLLDKHLFVFTNKRRKILKCLYWDMTGFALWTKWLDSEVFPWPGKLQKDILSLSDEQLRWILEGIDIWKIKKHSPTGFKRIY